MERIHRFHPSRTSVLVGTTSEQMSTVTLMPQVLPYSLDALVVGQKLHLLVLYGGAGRTVISNSVIIVASEGDKFENNYFSNNLK